MVLDFASIVAPIVGMFKKVEKYGKIALNFLSGAKSLYEHNKE
jgi:hypothetical protein